MANYQDSSSIAHPIPLSFNTSGKDEVQAADYQSFSSAASTLQRGQWKLTDLSSLQRPDGTASQSYNPPVHFYVPAAESVRASSGPTRLPGLDEKVNRDVYDKVVAERDEALQERDVAIQARNMAEQNLAKMRKRLVDAYGNLRGIQNVMDDIEAELYPELPCPSRYIHHYGV